MRSSNRSGWWIGILAGAVGGLVVLLFTGLVAPGFMLGEDTPTGNNLPASETGGGTTKRNLLLDTNPYETVRKVYHHIAGNTPDQVCGRFTTEAAQQFARDFTAADCAQAVSALNTRVDRSLGSKNRYAEPDFRGKMSEIPQGDTIEISSCNLDVVAGPRLGTFTLGRIEQDQWIITAHSKDCAD